MRNISPLTDIQGRCRAGRSVAICRDNGGIYEYERGTWYITACLLMLMLLASSFSALAAIARDSDPSQGSEANVSTYYEGTILKIDPTQIDAVLEYLESEGVKVLYQRDDLLLVFIPYNEVSQINLAPSKRPQRAKAPSKAQKIAANPGILRMERRKAVPNQPTMNKARQWYEAENIFNGVDLPMPYDGTGVVVGFCDTGFDARHVNFLNAAGTACRIKRAVQYLEVEGQRNVYTTPEEIWEWHTDTPFGYHGTHTAGILTGAYQAAGYHGMAPGADIVATTSDLTDVGLLAGVEDVIAYAKEVGKPCVVNMSVGTYTGPHDGSSLFCQYLDKCGEDAIICLSAGNEGQGKNWLGKTFSEGDTELIYRLANNQYNNFDMYGQFDAYSADSSPIKIAPSVADQDTYTTVCQLDTIDFSVTPKYVVSSTQSSDPTHHYSAEFAKYFNGTITFQGGIDPNNGRYYFSCEYDCVTEPNSSHGKWALYRLDGAVIGDPGTHVDLFADSQYSWFTSLRLGNKNITPIPSSGFSVSDFATGHNTICVGMYNNVESVQQLGGGTFYGGTPGEVNVNSGYGTLLDGRVLPLTVAPGGCVVSSMNGAYIEEEPSQKGYCVMGATPTFPANPETPSAPSQPSETGVMYAASDSGYQLYDPNETYYWCPETGTSMSSPYVAGSIATWLQADPTLKVADVQKLLQTTNDKTHTYAQDPRNGQGMFQPYNALVEVVKNSTTDTQQMLGKSLFLKYGKEGLCVLNPDGREMTLTVYSPSGALEWKMELGKETSCCVPMQNLGSGIHIAHVSAPGATSQTLKIAK